MISKQIYIVQYMSMTVQFFYIFGVVSVALAYIYIHIYTYNDHRDTESQGAPLEVFCIPE